MSKIKYIALQLSILIIPPFFFSIFYHINEYLNLFETFVGYSCGVIGLFLMFLIGEVVGSESMIFIIFFPLSLIIHFSIFQSIFYKNAFIKISIIINIVFVVWKIALGMFWMFAAMQ